MLSLCCICTAGIQTSSKHTGGLQTYGSVQTYGGIQMYWAYGHPLSLIKHVFFVLCMYKRHPNIWGIQTYGGIQTYAEHSNIWGCPNIQGEFLHAFLSHEVGFATSNYLLLLKVLPLSYQILCHHQYFIGCISYT